jgi:hypothetical protein
MVYDEKSELVQKILKTSDKLDHTAIKEYTLRLFSTAFNCNKEIAVAKKLLYMCIASSSNEVESFFFPKVWMGKIYLSEKMDALDDLISELESTKKLVCDKKSYQLFYMRIIDE